MNHLRRIVSLGLFVSLAGCGGGGGGGNGGPPAPPPPPPVNVDLSGITLSAGTLDPPFSASVFDYSAIVDSGTADITVTVSAADSGSSITINGTLVGSGSTTSPIALPVGPSAVAIVVSNGGTNRTTTIAVTRRDATAASAAITFPPAGLTDASSINVSGTASDPETAIIAVTVNGIAAMSADGFATWRASSVPLSLGSNTVTVAVENAGLAVDSAAATVTMARAPLLLNPRDIELDTARNRALIADSTNAVVVAVDIASGALTELSGANVGSGPALEAPRAVAVDASMNRALIADDGADAIVAVDLDTGNRSIFIDRTRPDWDFFYGMELDAANDRVLTAAFTGRDELFGIDLNTANETLIADIFEPGVDPGDIALDAPNNRVLVSDSFFGNINAVSLDGVTPLMRVSGGTLGTGPDFRATTGVILDPANNRLLATDSILAAVFAADIATGDRFILSDAGNGTGPELTRPFGLVADAGNSRVLVIDAGIDAVLAVDPTSGNRSILGETSVGSGFKLDIPLFFDIDETNGRLIVIDSARDTVVGANLANGDRTEIGSTFSLGVGNTPIVVDGPGDRAFFADGSGFGPVSVMDLTSGAITQIPFTPGAGPDLFVEGMAYDAVNDFLLVSDSATGDGTVIGIDPETGNRFYISRSQGSQPGQEEVGTGPRIIRPQGIALDLLNLRVFVADDFGNAIIAADLATGDRTTVSDDATGTGPELSRLDGIAYDGTNNRVLVAEFFPPSIVAVDLTTGNRSYFSDNDGAGSGPRLVKPGDVKVDEASGVIYVGDEGLSAILAVDPQNGDRVILTK